MSDDPPNLKVAPFKLPADIGAQFKEAVANFDRAKTFTDLARLASTVNVDRALGLDRVMQQIADQERSIAERFGAYGPRVFPNAGQFEVEAPQMPDISRLIPPNPIHETNERLERIEQRFEELAEIGAEAARITTALQASAAIFINQFEVASKNNDRSARRAIRTGVLAVIAAVVFPVLQIAYTEFWVNPSSVAQADAASAAIVESLVNLNAVIAATGAEAERRSSEQNAAVVSAMEKLGDRFDAGRSGSVEDAPVPMSKPADIK